MVVKELLIIYINKLVKIISNYYEEKTKFYELVIKTPPIKCETKPEVMTLIIKVIFALLLFSLFWLVADTIYNLYNYLKLSGYLYFKNNSRLIDSPLFIQLNKLYYINDYFSIDLLFLVFITTPLFILAKLFILEYSLKEEDKNYFRLTKYYCYLIMIVGIIYYILIYKPITDLGKRLNIANNIIYSNINADFINSEKICNYIKKKSEYDYEFIYGKCNDIRSSISISKLYSYIKKNIQEIQSNFAPISDISIDKFKTLTDNNGKLYKDKLISAFFTFQLVKYYIDNDLIDEAKEFFAAYNIFYLKDVNLLRKKINPILYARIDNLMIFNSSFKYNLRMADSFGNNKDLYNYIYNEVNKKQNNIQNIIVDIFNICSYKLISVYSYYFVMFIIFILFVIFYIYINNK